MARKPHDPIEPEVLPGKVPGHAITLSEEAAVKQIEQDQFAMVMQDIGAMRALSFIRKISGRAQVEIYLKLKETKGWKSVPHPDGRKFSDLDELCDVYLGETGRSIRNKVPNYHLLGPALYEVSERMGFKPRDYAALKALPADDQEVIKQAMQPEVDRDQILDLMQEMAARHASEKAALTSKAKEAEDTAADRDRVIANKETRINALEVRVASAERRKANFTDIEKAGYECSPLHEAVAETIVGLKKVEREVARLLHEVGGDIVMEECVTAVLVAARCAVQLNRVYRLGIPDATMLDIIDEDERQALELKAMGITQTGAMQ